MPVVLPVNIAGQKKIFFNQKTCWVFFMYFKAFLFVNNPRKLFGYLMTTICLEGISLFGVCIIGEEILALNNEFKFAM